MLTQSGSFHQQSRSTTRSPWNNPTLMACSVYSISTQEAIQSVLAPADDAQHQYQISILPSSVPRPRARRGRRTLHKFTAAPRRYFSHVTRSAGPIRLVEQRRRPGTVTCFSRGRLIGNHHVVWRDSCGLIRECDPIVPVSKTYPCKIFHETRLL
jgi:hypothetical protein